MDSRIKTDNSYVPKVNFSMTAPKFKYKPKDNILTELSIKPRTSDMKYRTHHDFSDMMQSKYVDLSYKINVKQKVKINQFHPLNNIVRSSKKKLHMKALNSLDLTTPKTLDHLNQIPKYIDDYDTWFPKYASKLKESTEFDNFDSTAGSRIVLKSSMPAKFNKLPHEIKYNPSIDNEVTELITNRVEYELYKIENKRYYEKQEEIENVANNRELNNSKPVEGASNLIDMKNMFLKNISSTIQKTKDGLYLNFSRKNDFSFYESNFRIVWRVGKTNSITPDARRGATAVLYLGRIYVYGGFGHQIFSTMSSYDSNLNQWKEEIYEKSLTVHEIPKARFGHVAQLRNGEMYIYGGSNHYNNSHQKRISYNDIYKYNFSMHRWIKLNMCPFKRRYAACTLHFDKLYIHGGMDEYDNNKSDSFMYSIGKDLWFMLNDKITGIKMPALSMHSCASVVTKDMSNSPHFDIYHHPEYLKYSSSNKVYNIGVYFYGGMVQNHQHGVVEIAPTDRMLIVKTGLDKFTLAEVNQKNSGPGERFNHTMVYDETSHYLIVACGRRSMTMPSSLSDIWFFNVLDYHWVQVRENGVGPAARFGHVSVLDNQQMIVYGGCSDEGFMNSNVYMCDYNQNLVKKYLNDNDKINRRINSDTQGSSEFDRYDKKKKKKLNLTYFDGM